MITIGSWLEDKLKALMSLDKQLHLLKQNQAQIKKHQKYFT